MEWHAKCYIIILIPPEVLIWAYIILLLTEIIMSLWVILSLSDYQIIYEKSDQKWGMDPCTGRTTVAPIFGDADGPNSQIIIMFSITSTLTRL